MRIPNPWVLIPSLLAAVFGAAMGWIVTDVSCRVEAAGVVTSCPGWSLTMAIFGFLVGGLGMGTLLVLVYRSIAEAREAKAAGREEAEPGCETG
jgi:hypothetical protein